MCFEHQQLELELERGAALILCVGEATLGVVIELVVSQTAKEEAFVVSSLEEVVSRRAVWKGASGGCLQKRARPKSASGRRDGGMGMVARVVSMFASLGQSGESWARFGRGVVKCERLCLEGAEVLALAST